MPVSARERGSSRHNGRKHSGRGAWKRIEGIPLQATIVQPKTYLIMKARVYLSLGALLLFLAPLSCSDKAESPAPETPPEEQPVQPSEEYKEMYHSMEDNIKDEEPSLYYTYFRMRNASDQPLYIAARVRRNPYGFFYYLKPKEQATHWCCIENCAGLNFDMDQVLIKDLNKGLDYLEIYYRNDKAGTLGPEKDTAMLYNFIKPMTEESWKVFADALQKAQAVLQDESATEQQVQDALAALNSARAGLKLADDSTDGNADGSNDTDGVDLAQTGSSVLPGAVIVACLALTGVIVARVRREMR